MKRGVRFAIAGGLVTTLLVGVVVLLTLWSPTDAPSQNSLDYLKIIRSLSGVERRVEAHMAETSIEKGAKIRTMGDLSGDEERQIKQNSGGLIRQVRLRDDGAIIVRATMAPKRSSNALEVVEVNFIFVPEKMHNRQTEWRCFGSPISTLPQSCSDLETLKEAPKRASSQ